MKFRREVKLNSFFKLNQYFFLIISVFIFINAQFLPEISLARNAYIESLNKKADVKKKTRWTLADWFETKNKVHLMDKWLAANSSANLFEFYLSYSNYDYKQTQSIIPAVDEYRDNSSAYAIAGFLSIFGIKAEQSSDKISIHNQYEILLRILGDAEQSSRLNIFYGRDHQNSRQVDENSSDDFWGAELRLYLLSFLSLEGRFQKYLKNEMNDSGWDLISTYGLNVDLGPFQMFGLWSASDTGSNSINEIQREGIKYGLRMYF